MWDLAGWTALKEYKLSLRVARSGTKLSAPDAMPWQAEA